MASWKLCVLVLVFVILALTYDAEGRGGRRRNRDRDENENAEVSAGGRRQGGRGLGRRHRHGGNNGNIELSAAGSQGDRRRGQGRPGRPGAEEGGEGAGRPRGGRQGGGRRHRGHGGSRRGGPRPGGGRRRGGRGRGGGHRRRGGLSRRQIRVLDRHLRGFAQASGAFGNDMYAQLATRHPDNFVFSPLSIVTAMSMLKHGASGMTLRELDRGLSIPRLVDSSAAFGHYMNVSGRNFSSMAKLANAIYKRDDVAIEAEYLRNTSHFFNASINSLPESDRERAINNWVSEKTDGEIAELLEEGSLPDDIALYLINAVYFKGKWSKPFDEDETTAGDFMVSDSQTERVDYMVRTGDYRYGIDDTLDAGVLELPYEGDRFAFFIVIPDTDSSLAELEASMTHNNLRRALDRVGAMDTVRIQVRIPKFGLDTKQELKELLRAIGIQKVFTSEAELEQISSQTNLVVDEVTHRAVIELDEEGTTAAAATGAGISIVSLPPTVDVNKAFMFVLRDKERNINFFMGRFVNPSGSNLKQ